MRILYLDEYVLSRDINVSHHFRSYLAENVFFLLDVMMIHKKYYFRCTSCPLFNK